MKNKGITLIALVVTIVVLLILAGTSISMLGGENGIIDKATEAKILNNHATVSEVLKLKVIDKYSKDDTNLTSEDILEYLKEKGYIDNNNIVNVKETVGENLSTGNGSNGKDVYFIKDGDLYYSDKIGVEEKLDNLFDDSVEEELVATPEEYFDFDPNTGTISLKDAPYYIWGGHGAEVENGKNFPITNIVVPKTYNGIKVEKIGTFRYDNIKSVIIQEGIISINKYAFHGCDSLESIVIPKGITEIQEETFFSCDNLKIITIPDTVLRIKERAFSWNYNIETINYTGTEEQWKAIDIRDGNTDLTDAIINYNYTGE